MSSSLLPIVKREILCDNNNKLIDFLYAACVTGFCLLTALLGYFYRENNKVGELVINFQIVMTWPFVITIIRYLCYLYIYNVESPLFYAMQNKKWSEIKKQVKKGVCIMNGDNKEAARKSYFEYKELHKDQKNKDLNFFDEQDKVSF